MMRAEPIFIGVSFSMREGAGTRPDLIEPSVEALLSPVWTKRFSYLMLGIEPGKRYPRRYGALREGEKESVIREMLVHPDVCDVSLMTSSSSQQDFGVLSVGTRPRFSFSVVWCKGRRSVLGDPRAYDKWVDAMLELAARVEVVEGVLPVMNDSATHSEVAFGGICPEGEFRHPFPGEFNRMLKAQYELGTKYVRFPRWGTIYPHAHVEKLGGVERIREVVRPAVIRELGPNAVYVQLTESVATSLTEEALEKQRVFTELAAPVLPPPIPGEPEEGPNLRWLLESAKTLGQEVVPIPRKRKKRKKPAPAVVAAPPASPKSSEDSEDDDLPKPEPFF